MMARKKTSWSASAVPAMKDALARAITLQAREYERIALSSLPESEEQKLNRENAIKYHGLANFVDTADMYWVTDPMARIALDASQDIPRVTTDDMPSPNGLIVLEKPLPDIDLRETGQVVGITIYDRRTSVRKPDFYGPVAVDAILWSAAGEDVFIFLFAKSARLPGTSLKGAPPLELISVLHVTIPKVFEEDAERRGNAIAHGVIAWLATAWHLMTIPTTASVTPATVAKPKKPGVSKNTQEPRQVRDVKIVDLRPLHHHSEETAKAGDRNTPGHRWVVRGHWRNQPYGKKRAKRRVQWVESYIKGPDGAPLVERAIVNVWRR